MGIQVKDRSVQAIVIGIISLFFPLVGPWGWWAANDHIDSVDRGYLQHGRGLAIAGKVCSVISTLFLAFWVAIFAIVIVAALIGAAANG